MAFNAFKYELPSDKEWASVSVLHDGWTMRWRGDWSLSHPNVGRVLSEVTINATRLMVQAANLSSRTPNHERACYFERLRKGFLRICDLANLSSSLRRRVVQGTSAGTSRL